MTTAMTLWRSIQPIGVEQVRRILQEAGSPLAAEADEIALALGSHSTFGLAVAFHETKLGTLFTIPGIDSSYRNAWALKTAGEFRRFSTWAEGAAEFARRMTDPIYAGGAYHRALTIAEWIEVYSPARWGNDPVASARILTDRVDHYLATSTTTTTAQPLPPPPPPPVVVTPQIGLVPRPPIKMELIDKPHGAGWWDFGTRDVLVAVVLHNVLGNASTTGQYFATYDPRYADGGHGWNALTDWGVCNTNDGALDGTIIQWNDPDGRRSPYASGGTGTKFGDGPAIIDLCRRLGRNLNQATEAIEISRRRNYDPVSQRCLKGIIDLTAWRVDRKSRVPWNVFPRNNHGVHMIATHAELGKPECNADDVAGEVIAGVIERLKFYQLKGTPVPAPEFVKPIMPDLGEWDGKDRTFKNVLFRAIRRQLTVVEPTPALLYAHRGSKQVRAPIGKGETFHILYHFQTEGEDWVLTTSGARVPVKDCTPTIAFS